MAVCGHYTRRNDNAHIAGLALQPLAVQRGRHPFSMAKNDTSLLGAEKRTRKVGRLWRAAPCAIALGLSPMAAMLTAALHHGRRVDDAIDMSLAMDSYR